MTLDAWYALPGEPLHTYLWHHWLLILIIAGMAGGSRGVDAVV